MVFFKYRGTTIRLSSTKLCIVVSFVFATVATIITLHEMMSLSRNPVDPLAALNSNIGVRLNSTSSAPESNRISTTTNNINNNIFQEGIRYHTITHNNNWSVPPEIRQLRQTVRTRNEEEHIRNAERFGKTISDKTIVIIVQVHNRANYFFHLLKSLGRSKGIENALLITSHDFYSEEINRLVESVDFCKVLQIFFPFSDQLYPNEFPGNDPNDCPRDMTRQRAREISCNNAATPDMYGHYREAKFTMTKHHWWWKANQVFDSLNITKSYTGPVLFLEEDYYVTPDIHHMLKLVYDGKKSSAKDCDLITLGTYTTLNDYNEEGGVNVVEIVGWRSHDHNMGLAFDKETWNKIKKCSELFCRSYDEYNWDWTMMKISSSCAPHKFMSLVLKGPRVFHLGECGLHHKKSDCNVAATVNKYDDIIDKNMQNFFPPSIHIQPGVSREVKFSPNGGWGDPRDHALCFKLMNGR